MKSSIKRHKCRNPWCNNHYDDVIGGDHAFGQHKAGAVCIPCLYAEQMAEHGQTIEQVEQRNLQNSAEPLR